MPIIQGYYKTKNLQALKKTTMVFALINASAWLAGITRNPLLDLKNNPTIKLLTDKTNKLLSAMNPDFATLHKLEAVLVFP